MSAQDARTAGPAGAGRRARAVLATAALAHVVHDGFSDVLYVLLPVWATEFRLTLTQVGVIRTVFTAGMAASQIPAGLLSERWGERRLLAAGTALTAAAFVVVGRAGGFAGLCVVLLLAGLGSGVQHPLSSSLVSKAYETGRRRAALGTYNFSGDLGKIAVPAAVALAATLVGWRAAVGGYGLVGLAAAVAIAVLLARLGAGQPEQAAGGAAGWGTGWGIRDARGFRALSAIGMIDTATRTVLLTFLPFILMAKGLTIAGVGVALAVLFAGGACGKFVCGLVAERVGVVRTVVLTEAATAVGMLAIVAGSRPVILGVLLPFGVALNGTSSVLYATVADLATPERRSRAYALYYTLIVAASALAPILYGMLGDRVGVPPTLIVSALICLLTIPLCLALRPAITAAERTLTATGA